ncbi:hypothetical protein RDWZM_006585 [Blomia tropicalis]|uniref:Pyrroline-5-carboxylate reductase 3 n=1 Tax=Blomia tropicalis TaxID=40697 RepID=A0A9Q0M6G1_BLOTA|nr:hypothetical protein RDWZM_006585 [Blomia tropicalis]
MSSTGADDDKDGSNAPNDGNEEKSKSKVEDQDDVDKKTDIKSGIKSEAKSNANSKTGEDAEEQAKPANDEKKDTVEATTSKKIGTFENVDGADIAKTAKSSKVDPGEPGKPEVETKKSEVDARKSGVDARKSGVEARKSGTAVGKSGCKSGVHVSNSTCSAQKRTRSNASTKSRSKVPELTECRIGFVGSGRMAESMMRGLLKSGRITGKQLYVAAKTTKNLDTFKVQGASVSTRTYDIFGRYDCDIVFLCVHGFVVRNCFKLGGTRPAPFTTNYIPTRRRQIFILSMIGGVPLCDVRTTLLNPETGNKYKVEMNRLVLNASVSYGIGLGALDIELDSKKCHPLVRDSLQTIARIECVSAEVMDAVCAMMGSGIAFVYYFISALADGGFKMGLTKQTATKLATKTIKCASQCLLESNKNPIDLRDQCTSPSGPAIYGLAVLDKQDCASGVQVAIESAYRRIQDLTEASPDQFIKQPGK